MTMLMGNWLSAMISDKGQLSAMKNKDRGECSSECDRHRGEGGHLVVTQGTQPRHCDSKKDIFIIHSIYIVPKCM